MKIVKLLVAPIEISGIGTGLVAGFRELGVVADQRLKFPHPFAYAAEEVDSNPVVAFWQAIGRWRVSPLPGGALTRLVLRGFHLLVSVMVLVIFAKRYDAFIFVFGRTITGSALDLLFLRLLGKRTVVLFCGSDSRPPFMDGARDVGDLEGVGLLSSLRLMLHTYLTHRRVTYLERYADFMVDSPASGHFHRRKFINWFCMGIPCRVLPVAQAQPRPQGGRVRILHSPSNPKVKGTAKIQAIIEKLVAEGLPVDLVLLQNATNAQVIDQIMSCDIVCDQLYADTPMAAFASEAAALGRPSIVGGHFASEAGRYIDEADLPPTSFVIPSEFESALRRMVVDVGFRQQMGEAAREFVGRRWTAAAVASRYLKLLQDEVPPGWWCDPLRLYYAGGCGMEMQGVGARVHALVSRFGRRALMLSDKPVVEAALLALAERAGRDAK